MRIAIDLLPITGQDAGLQSYAKQLVTSLAKVDQQSEYILLVNAHVGNLFDIPARNFKPFIVRTPKWVIRYCRYWEQVYLPIMPILRNVDLLHCPVSALPFWAPCKTVVTVYDLTFKFFPETMKWLSRLYWSYFLTKSIKKADKIIVPSRSTSTALQQVFSISSDRIVIIEASCPERFFYRKPLEVIEATKRRYNIKGKYILTVGTLEPRKNITTLLEAFSIVKKELAIQLVIVGRRGWLDQAIYKKIKELSINEDVVFTGYVLDEDLPALYQGAEVFVFPSLYEGFGLPPLEAMASGTPVVASNSSSIPEVVGDAGILVDPRDIEGFAYAIVKLCTDASYRAMLSTKGQQRAHHFTLERMGEKMVEVYREVSSEVNEQGRTWLNQGS
jgi:glycosyltransferase involved in cell wall biosynthesis